jgi:hypothetical protein
MTNEDSLRDYYDKITTHNEPHSPYHDGPVVGEDCCEHGVLFCDQCQDCEEEEESRRLDEMEESE